MPSGSHGKKLYVVFSYHSAMANISGQSDAFEIGVVGSHGSCRVTNAASRQQARQQASQIAQAQCRQKGIAFPKDIVYSSSQFTRK